MNSTVFFKITGAKLLARQGVCPPNRRDDLYLGFCLNPSSMLRRKGKVMLWINKHVIRQNWEFAHRLFEQIARLLWANEQKVIRSWFALLSWTTGANHSWSLFCKERREQFAYGHPFLKSTESDLLPSLFKKERLSEERPEQLALVHKKGEKLSKT